MAEEALKDEGKKDAKGGGGGSKLLSLLLVALVAGLAAGGGVAAVMYFGGGAKNAEAAQGEEGEAKHDAKPPVVSAVIGFEPFVVNLADPSGDRYLKVSLRVVANDAHVAEAFEKDELTKARVRDRIISVLTSKMFGDISNPTGKEALRRELAKEINTVLPHDAVQEVLFVEFAIQ